MRATQPRRWTSHVIVLGFGYEQWIKSDRKEREKIMQLILCSFIILFMEKPNVATDEVTEQ